MGLLVFKSCANSDRITLVLIMLVLVASHRNGLGLTLGRGASCNNVIGQSSRFWRSGEKMLGSQREIGEAAGNPLRPHRGFFSGRNVQFCFVLFFQSGMTSAQGHPRLPAASLGARPGTDTCDRLPRLPLVPPTLAPRAQGRLGPMSTSRKLQEALREAPVPGDVRSSKGARQTRPEPDRSRPPPSLVLPGQRLRLPT